MPRIKLLKSGELSEETIQRTVMQWVRMQPSLKYIVMHIPNEGKRSPAYGQRLKDAGMVAGVWDILIATGRHGHIGAWIELKSKDGTLSTHQERFGEVMAQQNYFTTVCRTIDDAISTIEWYCFH